MLKVGIIGCGHWGSNHLRVFNSLEKADVVYCCDQDINRLNVINKIYPNLKTTSDYHKILKDREIDAVIIATPTASHYEIAKLALLNGKHVLCEKPLTVKAEESDILLSLSREKQRILMVGYVFLFNNGIAALKDLIKESSMGKIHYMHFTRTNLGPIRDDVDVIYDLASHDISIASFLLGALPNKVSANGGFFLRKKICDAAFITLYYPANILVNIHVSWLDPKKVRCLTCVGDKKMAVWDDLNTSEPLRIFNKGVIREPFYSDYGEFQLLTREGEIVSPLVKLSEPLKNQSQYFLECTESKRQPITDAAFGCQVTRVLEASQVSLKNKGREERIAHE